MKKNNLFLSAFAFLGMLSGFLLMTNAGDSRFWTVAEDVLWTLFLIAAIVYWSPVFDSKAKGKKETK